MRKCGVRCMVRLCPWCVGGLMRCVVLSSCPLVYRWSHPIGCLIMFCVCRWPQDGGPQYAHQHGRRQGTTISIAYPVTYRGPFHALFHLLDSLCVSPRTSKPRLTPLLLNSLLCMWLSKWIIGGGCAGPAVCGDADRVEVLRQPHGLDPHGQQRRLQPHPLWRGELRHR